ncbi:hydroxylysine kinase-like isoform X2 [Mizuhopecten yessoensis]|uniref:hydroxylysine kinase-like isoform X2 n=1 Tax=Mizuhopecten yessoensis TaxID=6573 RepID=UPI000B45764F|nr:hydroxylysine kinase-like isoform X2 [Mizuhopecten yessoensis]
MGTAVLRHAFVGSVTELLRAKYGLIVTSQRQLDGYVDVNVWVDVSDVITNPHINERHHDGYVVKLINENDSQRPPLLDARQRLMLYVNKAGIPAPLPVRTITGCYTSSVELVTKGDVIKRQIVVMSFFRGIVLSDLSMTPDVLQELGRITGKLNICMQTFPDITSLEYDSVWKVCECGQLLSLVEHAPGEKLRTMSISIITEFNSKVVPNLQTYQTGLIHHDVGPQNIVMRQDMDQRWKMAAILDFGDVCSSCYVFEVAILLSNIFMNEFSRSMTTSEMALTRDTVFDSYTAVKPLSTNEKEVVDICVEARILQCCLLGEKTRETDPGNDYIGDYICWELLESLCNTCRD